MFRKDRSGWFVSFPRITYDPTHHINFARIVELHGRMPRWELIGIGRVRAGPRLASFFEHRGDLDVFRMTTLCSIDDRRVALQEYFLDAEVFPDLDQISHEAPLTDTLRKHYGVQTEQRRITIRPTRLNEWQAHALGLTPSAPGLFIRRLKVERSGRVVEVDNEFWRHDIIEFSIEK
ncbi:DNA-binding transcriptional regulator, GntR family [Bradyrhizobium sp. Gha]|nr:DNA-binding transcriptional regulator, GntR family [Bradyrhizobium sp. Gha]